MSESKRRSIVPGALVVVGLAGLSLAAASELDLNWGGTFQAGAVEVQADCQDGPIDVTFAEPQFASASELPWTVDSVEFSGISSACQGFDYQAAYQLSEGGDWLLLDPKSLVVEGTTSAWLRDATSQEDLDPQTIHGFALTIQN